jgi:FecR-like protein
MSDDKDDTYLWDGSGEPDPDVVRLERLLKRLRHEGDLPALPRRASTARRALPRVRILLAAAASLAVAAGAAWLTLALRTSSWGVQNVSGTTVVAGETVRSGARLNVGEWVVTDGASRARIAVGHIGQVDVDPNTRVQLVAARGREHRMALERGTIHARIWAPPKFFFVNTPSATVIDLGCAYTLQVDDSGAGLLRVTHGWVGFERDGREAYIPQGAVCATRPDVGPGTPRYEDAPSGYGEALGILDFGAPGDPRRPAAFELVLSQARRRDALTLWHLLARGPVEERGRVYDRLMLLAPAPQGVTRVAVLSGDRMALSLWWDSLGMDTGTWWRLLKKKW